MIDDFCLLQKYFNEKKTSDCPSETKKEGKNWHSFVYEAGLTGAH